MNKHNPSFSIYLVGGAVRDTLLKRPVTEKDWVVVGAEPNDLLSLGYHQVGKDFPVFLHPKTKEEYALARKERKQGKGYTGFNVDASKHITLEEDLLRRDLTINAIAQDNSGKLIDPYNGKRDLNNRLLRHVSDAFVEDPLRVLRVARFAARYAYLNFTIAPETLHLMKQISQSGELSTLPAERIWRETEKAMEERTPYVFFKVLIECGALEQCFGALSPLVKNTNAEQLATCMTSIAQSDRIHSSISHAQCACICHAISKDTNDPTAWLRNLKSPNMVIRFAKTVVAITQWLSHFNYHDRAANAPAVLSLFNDVDVWRKQALFDSALDLVSLLPFADSSIDIDVLSQTLRDCLNEAKSVTAQSVISETVTGAKIKQAMNEKRQKRICQRLALW